MHKLFQDAMSVVRVFGKPDLFITFTCNPYWVEIKRELLSGQVPADRPDLCARVFFLKLKELFRDLYERHVLGTVVARIQVIEFQTSLKLCSCEHIYDTSTIRKFYYK